MSVWFAVVVLVGCVWFAGACGWAGALWERERLLNEEGNRDWRWVGAWLFSSALWPFVGLMWPRSRPVPAAQPDPEWPEDYRGKMFVGGKDIVDLVGSSEELLPQDAAEGTRSRYEVRGVFAVDRPTSLALSGRILVGEKAFVRSLNFTLVRGQMYWYGESCGCRYNFSGFPVVVCRTHRSDVDPQGEPDESEGEVGR